MMANPGSTLWGYRNPPGGYDGYGYIESIKRNMRVTILSAANHTYAMEIRGRDGSQIVMDTGV